MNYFQVKRAERLFREYKQLALRYWEAQPEDKRDQWARWAGAKRVESDESLALREQVNLRFPEVNELADELGVAVTWKSFPAPAVGGPIIPVNALMSVIDQEMGHAPIEKRKILDVINRCIGTAELVKKRALHRMLNPVFWPIDMIAFVIRIPFLILRKAGLPTSVEENVISHVLKVLMAVGILLFAAYLGLQEHLGAILKALGK